MPSLPPILRSLSTTSKWWSLQPLDRGVAVGGFIDVVSRLGEAADQTPPERIVIVRYQNSSHGLVLVGK